MTAPLDLDQLEKEAKEELAHGFWDNHQPATVLALIQRVREAERDIESGFMAGAYARFKNMQDAERERDSLRSRLKIAEEALEHICKTPPLDCCETGQTLLAHYEDVARQALAAIRGK